MITIDRRLLQLIRKNPGSIILQVNGGPDSAVSDALRNARRILSGLDSGSRSAPGLSRSDRNNPKFVAGPIPARPGPMLHIDGGHMRIRDLLTIPEIVRQELIKKNVEDATITSPSSGLLQLDSEATLYRISPSLALRLYPYPPLSPRGWPTTPPTHWIEPVWQWFEAQSVHEEQLVGISSPAVFAMTKRHARAFIEEAWRARSFAVYVVSGQTTTRVALVRPELVFGTVTLALGGPELTPDDLDNAAAPLKALARALAPDLSLGFLSVGVLGGDLNTVPYRSDRRAPDAAPAELVREVCDEAIFDAYHFQVLHPNHMRRIGRLTSEASELAQGHVEWTFGRAADWGPLSRTLSRVQSRARQRLARCLLSAREVIELRGARGPNA